MTYSDKTLYISDLDGTLLNQSAELTLYTKTALNRMIEDGLRFTIATARTPATANIILEGVRWDLPLVLLNGVVILDNISKRYKQVLSICADAVAAIIDVLALLNVTGIMYQFTDSGQYQYYESLDHTPIRNFVESRITRYNKVFHKTDSFKSIAPENITYFTLIDSYDKIMPVYDALLPIAGICRSIYKDNYSPDLWYLEIHSENASKKNALIYLRDMYGFERIIGFGDNLNDLPMFEACDVRVAVENAFPEVKAASDLICGSNTDDGVVKWLEEYGVREDAK